MIVWHKHHLVPRYNGGSNDKSNIIKVNVALHAFLHKMLWEEHGRWQDEVAWKALSGQITGAELSLAINKAKARARTGHHNHMYGKKGNLCPHYGKKRSEETRRKMSVPKEYRRKKYEITHPDGKVEIIRGLVEFCQNHGVNKSNLCQVAKGKKTSC